MNSKVRSSSTSTEEYYKWTNGENPDQLLEELRAKAERLPFANGHEIVAKLFLKTAPDSSSNDIYLPEDVINMI